MLLVLGGDKWGDCDLATGGDRVTDFSYEQVMHTLAGSGHLSHCVTLGRFVSLSGPQRTMVLGQLSGSPSGAPHSPEALTYSLTNGSE